MGVEQDCQCELYRQMIGEEFLIVISHKTMPPLTDGFTKVSIREWLEIVQEEVTRVGIAETCRSEMEIRNKA